MVSGTRICEYISVTMHFMISTTARARVSRSFREVFAKFSQVFRSFRRLGDVFGPVAAIQLVVRQQGMEDIEGHLPCDAVLVREEQDIAHLLCHCSVPFVYPHSQAVGQFDSSRN